MVKRLSLFSENHVSDKYLDDSDYLNPSLTINNSLDVVRANDEVDSDQSLNESELTVLYNDGLDSGKDSNLSELDTTFIHDDSCTEIYEEEWVSLLEFLHKGFSILYTNAESLVNKLDELGARTIVLNPDIIIISEM